MMLYIVSCLVVVDTHTVLYTIRLPTAKITCISLSFVFTDCRLLQLVWGLQTVLYMVYIVWRQQLPW